MHKPLLGEKMAVLVANGFSEKGLTTIQRSLQPLGVSVRIIGMDNGLVNSWNGEGWGLNFAADSALSSALAADFSMLVIPGGQRSIDKLKLTAHTRRFVGGFVDCNKPVVAVAEGVDLLAFSERLSGRTVSAPQAMMDVMEQGGASFSEESYTVDGSLLTMSSQDDVGEAYADVITDFLVSQYTLEEAA